MNGFSYVDLLSLGKDRDLTWSFLFYIGLLTCGPEDGHLRIPNNVVKTRVCIFLTFKNFNLALIVTMHWLYLGPETDYQLSAHT